jgi:hypothetical protein
MEETGALPAALSITPNPVSWGGRDRFCGIISPNHNLQKRFVSVHLPRSEAVCNPDLDEERLGRAVSYVNPTSGGVTNPARALSLNAYRDFTGPML